MLVLQKHAWRALAPNPDLDPLHTCDGTQTSPSDPPPSMVHYFNSVGIGLVLCVGSLHQEVQLLDPALDLAELVLRQEEAVGHAPELL